VSDAELVADLRAVNERLVQQQAELRDTLRLRTEALERVTTENERLRLLLDGGASAEGARKALTEVVALARRADAAEAALADLRAKVEAVATRWADYATYCRTHPENPHRPRLFWDVAARRLRTLLEGKP
jgi:phage shock protein A